MTKPLGKAFREAHQHVVEEKENAVMESRLRNSDALLQQFVETLEQRIMEHLALLQLPKEEREKSKVPSDARKSMSLGMLAPMEGCTAKGVERIKGEIMKLDGYKAIDAFCKNNDIAVRLEFSSSLGYRVEVDPRFPYEAKAVAPKPPRFGGKVNDEI